MLRPEVGKPLAGLDEDHCTSNVYGKQDWSIEWITLVDESNVNSIFTVNVFWFLWWPSIFEHFCGIIKNTKSVLFFHPTKESLFFLVFTDYVCNLSQRTFLLKIVLLHSEEVFGSLPDFLVFFNIFYLGPQSFKSLISKELGTKSS